MTTLNEYLKQHGHSISAAKALFKTLREERGITIRLECLPDLFNIGENFEQVTGMRNMPDLMTVYAVTHDLTHPEEILDHLIINGTNVECNGFFRENPLPVRCVEPKSTRLELLKRGKLAKQADPYEVVRAYLGCLLANGLSTIRSDLEKSVEPELLASFSDPLRTFNLMTDFSFSIAFCNPGWTNIHPSFHRVKLGGKWRDDSENYFIDRVREINYEPITNVICPDCNGVLIKS